MHPSTFRTGSRPILPRMRQDPSRTATGKSLGLFFRARSLRGIPQDINKFCIGRGGNSCAFGQLGKSDRLMVEHFHC